MRGIARKPPLVLRLMGVDERATGHGQQYATLVGNHEKGTGERVGEERKKETLDLFFQSWNLEQNSAIKGMALGTCSASSVVLTSADG